LLIAVAALFAGCDETDPTGPDRTAEAFDWQGAIAQGDRIEIKTINGDVRASFTSGDEVVVHATRTARESDPASVTIEVVPHAGGVTICAVYPDVPGREPNACRPGLDGQMSTRYNDVEVGFTLLIPAGVEFVGRTLHGDVTAEGLKSDAFASTTWGDVTVTTTGIAEASSTSGSVSASIGRADPGRDLRFSTITGDVTVRVPANINARVFAATTSGTIASDFPLEGQPRTRSGTLGSGGPNLRLTTVNGNVNLRGGPAQH
jgi:hypothetical protein